MDAPDKNRRSLLIAGSAGIIATAGLVLTGCGRNEDEKGEKDENQEVGATEDMMREHGVLRRALLVYAEAAQQLHDGQVLDPSALGATAQLFRTFGEDYHERQLEETHVFPAVREVGGAAATLCGVLVAQHNRGREITDYITNIAARGRISQADTEPLARTLESFVLMYQNHAAREDTIIFPAWKTALSESQLHEMGEMFEEIEHQKFGEDGFDDAVQRVAQIEQTLGFADLSQFTAPTPPIK